MGYMLKIIAALLGILYILLGIVGFIPNVAPDGYLLGIFHVNTLHNVLRILAGGIALWVSYSSALATRILFQIFGLVFLVIGILGFIYVASHPLVGWFHLLLGIVALYWGFKPKKKKSKNALGLW